MDHIIRIVTWLNGDPCSTTCQCDVSNIKELQVYMYLTCYCLLVYSYCTCDYSPLMSTHFAVYIN